MSKPMPEPTMKEMVEWLKDILSEFEGHKSIRNYAIWKVGQYDLKIIRAVLATLEPVTEGMREEMLTFYDDLTRGVRDKFKEYFNDWIWEERVEMVDKIRNLILGKERKK